VSDPDAAAEPPDDPGEPPEEANAAPLAFVGAAAVLVEFPAETTSVPEPLSLPAEPPPEEEPKNR
jgi:hypothetical protein